MTEDQLFQNLYRSSKDEVIRTVGLRKPILSRQMHLRINNRAWNKDALSKPITVRRLRDG